MSQYAVYPDLRGKTAFVTGGSGGIGAETCRWLAANHVKVAVSGRNEAALRRVVEDLQRFDVQTISIAADCTDADAIERGRHATEENLGPVDILLAFAGGGRAMPAPVDRKTEENWRSGIDHNHHAHAPSRAGGGGDEHSGELPFAFRHSHRTNGPPHARVQTCRDCRTPSVEQTWNAGRRRGGGALSCIG